MHDRHVQVAERHRLGEEQQVIEVHPAVTHRAVLPVNRGCVQGRDRRRDDAQRDQQRP